MVIYDINGNKLLDAILTEGAEHEEELGKTNLVRFSWDSDAKTTIPAGAYVIPFEGGLRYRLLNSYTPTEDSKCFKYTPEFHHPLMLLGRISFLYATKDAGGNDIKQQEWSFEGLTTTALQYACDAINEAFDITNEDEKFTYTLCGTVDASVSFPVSSNDILSVLSSIAQACKDNACEWHLSWEHRVLYFGQISINLGEEAPVLKVHDNIQSASVSESKENYYNCFYPQGSTKNMSRKALVGEGNVATLARLGLDKDKYPDGCIYIDTEGKVTTKSEFEASNAVKQTLALSFDGIFPHIDLYAYNIRKRTRWLKNDTTGEWEKNPDGTNKTYTVWYMRLAYPSTAQIAGKTPVNTTTDNGITYYWYDYDLDRKKQVLQGYTLKGIFKVNTHTTNNQYDALTQSLVGQPSGQDGFELNYHETNETIPASEPTGDSGVSVLKGDYEIVMYQSGDTIIPTNEDEGLIPHGKDLPDFTCNIVVLFNIVMGEYETKLAQEELATRTIKTIADRVKDKNNYTALSNAVSFEKNNPNLYVGQKVTFDDGQGYKLSTRVIKLITKLDYPIIQEITVGNQAVKGAISQLKEDVNNILSGNFSGGGMNAAQTGEILQNFTNTHLLRKDIPDTAQKLTTFLEGIALGKEEGRYYLDANGFAKLYRLILSSVTSSRYVPGDEGRGFSLSEDEDGTGTLEVDNLKVRKKMTALELEVRKKTYTTGNLSLGKAGNTIFAVRPYASDHTPIGDKVFSVGGMVIAVSDGSVSVLGQKSKGGTPSFYRCYFLRTDGERAVDNCWEIGDQAKCQTNNLVEGTTMNAANRYYWRIVVGKGTETLEDGREYHYVDLSNEKHVEVSGKACTGYDASVENDAPMTGDDIAQEGSQTDKSRQGLMVIDADEGISKYKNIDSFSYEGKRKQHIGDTVELEVNRLTIVSEAQDGTPESYRVPCDMGAWTAKPHPYYARVSKDGSLWLCVNPAGAKASDIPSEGSTVWQKQVGRGGKGDPGEAAEFYRLVPVTESAVVGRDKKLTASFVYRIEHVVGNAITAVPATEDLQVRYRGNGGTPADIYMTVGDTPSSTYTLEDYPAATHPDYFHVELVGGGNILDRRTVPVTFSTLAALDIDGQVGKISAKVQGMTVGGRNLLKGTAFRKDYPDWFRLSSGATIDPAIRHDGHNSVDCTASGQAANVYKGVFFKTNVEPGKEYTASVWAYGEPATIDLDAHLEIIHTDAQGQRQHVALQSIKPTQTGTWQRTSCTFTVPAGAESIECNIFVVRNGNLHIAEPMLASGSMLTDWQPAPEDAEAYTAEVDVSVGRVDVSVTNMKTGLESVGIHLDGEEKKITLNGDTEMVGANGKPTAMFKDGKVSADVIDADKVVANGIQGNTIDAKNATFENVNINGSLESVSGSFRRLECVNNQGQAVANLTFGQSGIFEIGDGDLQMQGTKNGRPLRFLSSDIWCRGAFGHAERTCAVIKNDIMYVHLEGAGENGIGVRLPTASLASGETVYKIPMYGPGTQNLYGDLGTLINPNDPKMAGLPIDVVVFNCTASRYYTFIALGNGKTWTVINGNDRQLVRVIDMGGWAEIPGGTSADYFYVNPKWLTPRQDSPNRLGNGVFYAGTHDLNW